MTGHIVPMGAGKAVMDRRNDPLHDYVLELTGKDDPVVLFLPTATGDDASYIVSFYEAFHSGRCRPRHLRLFHRNEDDLTDIVLGADVIHVGGGNTANMLDVWKRQGVDRAALPSARPWRRAHRRERRRIVLVRRRYHRLLRPHPSAAPRGARDDQGQLLPALRRRGPASPDLPCSAPRWFSRDGLCLLEPRRHPVHASGRGRRGGHVGAGRSRAQGLCRSTARSSRRTSPAASSKNPSPAVRCPPEVPSAGERGTSVGGRIEAFG